MFANTKFRLLVAAALAFTGAGFAHAKHLSDKSVVERLKPVAEVYVEGVNAPPAAAPVVAAATGPRTGEQIVTAHCAACHATGAAGAPKIGTADWAPRKAKGEAALLEHAIKGFNAMPPKGMCMDCSDDDIKNAVEHMLAKSE